MKREDIDLVHVIWGDTDQGVVSLKRNAIVLYTSSKQFGGHHSFIPTIGIEDKDYFLDRDDVLMGDDNAPQWVKDWSGPFTITVSEAT